MANRILRRFSPTTTALTELLIYMNSRLMKYYVRNINRWMPSSPGVLDALKRAVAMLFAEKRFTHFVFLTFYKFLWLKTVRNLLIIPYVYFLFLSKNQPLSVISVIIIILYNKFSSKIIFYFLFFQLFNNFNNISIYLLLKTRLKMLKTGFVKTLWKELIKNFLLLKWC